MHEAISIDGFGVAEVRTTESDLVVLDLVTSNPWLDDNEAEALGNALIEAAEAIRAPEPSLKISASPTSPQPPVNIEAQVRAFIEAEVPILIKYKKLEDDSVVHRHVSPYEVETVKQNLFQAAKYLVGYDHSRDGIRNFRLSRIQGIAPALVGFRPRES
jgi:predicted DNA-binding transcriptional regulator YafY